ncbi:hypothetical protein Bbelb_125820 [Branchiostoma belcheri]|nr:hypothetical protein Bbelb_125820 [Branchiostoma belcheri]
MGKNPPGVLMFVLVVFKMLGTAEGDCSCTPSTCDCYGQGLTSVPQDLPTTITELDLTENQITTLTSGIPTPSITVTLPSGLNATVLSDGRVTVDENGNIIIRDATSLDVGLYTCIATSPVGSTSAGLSIDVVDVEPTIVKFDSSVNTLGERRTLSVVCEASGSPTPDITVILPSGLVTTVDVNGAVTITDVTAANSGLYVCIAVNVAGSTFSTLAVDLQTVQTTSPSITATIVTTPSKQPKPPPTFSQSVLLGAIFGSIAGTLIIVAIILTIWCKRNNQSPPKCPDFSVLFNNQTQKLTVLTNEYDLTHLKGTSVNKSE